MKTTLTIVLLILTLSLKGQDSLVFVINGERVYKVVDKEKFKLNPYIPPAVLIFVAGAFEGVQDHLAFHSTSNHPFFGQDSWKNKYIDKDPSKGKTFRGKYLVFTTDGFHAAKWGKNLFTMGAIVSHVSIGGKKRWHQYVLEGLAYWAINRISFNITYQALQQ